MKAVCASRHCFGSRAKLPHQPSPCLTTHYFNNDQLAAFREGDWKIVFIEVTGCNYRRHKLDQPTLYHLGRDRGEKFDQALFGPAVLKRLTEGAQKFEATINKAAPIFDKVTDAHGLR